MQVRAYLTLIEIHVRFELRVPFAGINYLRARASERNKMLPVRFAKHVRGERVASSLDGEDGGAVVLRIDYERNYRSRITINFHEARARGSRSLNNARLIQLKRKKKARESKQAN